MLTISKHRALIDLVCRLVLLPQRGSFWETSALNRLNASPASSSWDATTVTSILAEPLTCAVYCTLGDGASFARTHHSSGLIKTLSITHTTTLHTVSLSRTLPHTYENKNTLTTTHALLLVPGGPRSRLTGAR